ncbi:hypothetical protein ACBY01_05775 [Sphingomonas sp. ac-8]|uniref:hypothetical protein n=1 Tax=Sphingomonas sp. ac-8 TaxID=3242977 RepID=UPI003A7FB209
MRTVFRVIAVSLVGITMAAPAAPVRPAASAKRFVERLYGKAQPFVPDEQTYTPELARLIDRGYAVANEIDDPDLVGNALCDCQDLRSFDKTITVISATPTAASVRVLLTGDVDGPRRFLLKLARVDGAWRVADSIAEPGSSYAAFLRQSIEEVE